MINFINDQGIACDLFIIGSQSLRVRDFGNNFRSNLRNNLGNILRNILRNMLRNILRNNHRNNLRCNFRCDVRPSPLADILKTSVSTFDLNDAIVELNATISSNHKGNFSQPRAPRKVIGDITLHVFGILTIQYDLLVKGWPLCEAAVLNL